MPQLTYNKELSELIARKYGKYFQAKECYENAYKLATEYFDELKPASSLNVLFCYVPMNLDETYFRHAFCLFDGAIVEPLLHLNIEDRDIERIVPIRQMAVHEYLDLILKDKKYDLSDVLLQDDIKAINQSGIILNPMDLGPMVQKLIKTQAEFIDVMMSALNGHGIHLKKHDVTKE